MKNDVAKYLLVPGALGLALACPTQGIFAQEAQDLKGPVSNIMVSQPHEEPKLEVRLSSENPAPEPVQKEDTTAENDSATGEKITLTVGEDHVPADGSALTFDELMGDKDKGEKTPNTTGSIENKKSEEQDDKEMEEEDKLKNDRYPHSIDHKYEDSNYNKNFQDHSIEAENDGTYKFKKGEELTEEEIKKEFEKYRKNASSFVKVQEWLPKLKKMDLLGLAENETSQFYKVTLKDGRSIYSAKGFKSYIDKYGNAYVHDLTDDKVYKLDDGYQYSANGFYAPEVKNIYGASSDDIKNTWDDIDNPLYPKIGYNSKVYKTNQSNGAYVKALVDKNGKTYYEFYEGFQDQSAAEQAQNADIEKIKEIMKETPSELMNQWGKNHEKEILDRAYKAALVNSYLVEHEPTMSEELRKDIIDYVYRFGLNFESDESMVSKSEDNGYVNVSPLGYATKNPDGSYKYRYQVSFNSVTSNDKYSSTKLDVYAPTMANNIKFILNGIQEYIENSNGTYSYKNKDVNVELGIVKTNDNAIKKLLETDKKKVESQKESEWNNENHKHEENTFSIPYYNDLGNRTKLDNKVVEFDRQVIFNGDEALIGPAEGEDEIQYDSNYQVVRPETHYRHFRLVNPQQGGPVSFIVEFDIDADQVEKSPNIGLGARILGNLHFSDPTAFHFNSRGDQFDHSSGRPQVDNTGFNDANTDNQKVNQLINKTILDKRSELLATIYNHPELIKPGTFDINGFYGNLGGAPSEYTGDKYRIGLKTGKNLYNYGEFIESGLVKSIHPFKSEDGKLFNNTIKMKMRTYGASSFDIGVQIANGYGRYGDYRVNTRINEDRFIENLMKVTDVKLEKSDNLVSKDLASVYREYNYIDNTERFIKKDPNPYKPGVDDPVPGKEDNKKVDMRYENLTRPEVDFWDPKSEPGNGAKDLLSDNVHFGPAGMGLFIQGIANANSPRGGVDVTPIRCAKQKDGTWKYEYQISLRGLHSSDHGMTAGDYNIVMPNFVKNVEFSLIGNNNDNSGSYAYHKIGYLFEEGKAYDYDDYKDFLSEYEQEVFKNIFKNLKEAGVSSKLSKRDIEQILLSVELNIIYHKNEKLGILDWNPNTGKYISGFEELKTQYEKDLAFLRSIGHDNFTRFGKSLFGAEWELEQAYENARKNIQKQVDEGKKFLTEEEKAQFISPEDVKKFREKYVYSEYKGYDFNKTFGDYGKYTDSKGIRNFVDWKYKDKDKTDPAYKKELKEQLLNGYTNSIKMKLSLDSWTGNGNLYHESNMGDYKDVAGNPLNLITKLGYNYGKLGIEDKVNLSKVDIYNFNSRGSSGVVGLRVTFDVDEDQVVKTPYIPVDVRNAWKAPREDGGPAVFWNEFSEDILHHNNMADRIVHKETGKEISQAEYKALSDGEKANYYETNYYYVEHPEYITREMFDIHGLHTEPSVDVTTYTGKWQNIGEDISPWEDNLRKKTFDYAEAYKLRENHSVTYSLAMNEDFRDIAVVGPCATREKKEIIIKKEWLNFDKNKEVPEEITVVLSNGKDEQRVKLNKKNGYKLVLDVDDPLYDYRVKELEVPGYKNKKTDVNYRFVFKDRKAGNIADVIYQFKDKSLDRAKIPSFEDLVKASKEIAKEDGEKIRVGESYVEENAVLGKTIGDLIKNGYKLGLPLKADENNVVVIENGYIRVPRNLALTTIMDVELTNESIPETPPEEPETPPETPPEEPETPPETPPEEPETPPETPPEEPETPPETPPEEPETPPEEPETPPETPPVTPPEVPKTPPKAPQTGVEGIGSMMALMASSVAGLFVSRKKRKNQ
ncbi:LPXTG-motif protein cell wall anchor domain protein [Aedoeadaptatus nemausensis]|uniref:LPXTG-motif protein cell wall anchor domain protein n=1 Tax=Aedoeadaptatus nemausensis TaxID=2582829 RepID=A0A6V6Y317_9FIRM|nr:hypothetical protein [Peptoniphilus nemausensis]CAC9930339.1 LPXTG-motif protein cell wall anchor domain protein [Peptoniphilus nemausensis]